MIVLCVSADEQIEKQLGRAAEDQKWKVLHADRDSLSTAVAQHNPDCIFVDSRTVDDLDRFSKCPSLGSRGVVFIHGEMNPDVMANALNAGADIFLTTEVLSPAVFAACVNSLSRRQAARAERVHVARLGVTLNHEHERVESGNKSVAFTETEYKILRVLLKEDAAIVNRAEILTKVFGSSTISSRSLDVHICTLRKKLRGFNLDIVSVRGVGYKVRGVSLRALES